MISPVSMEAGGVFSDELSVRGNLRGERLLYPEEDG